MRLRRPLIIALVAILLLAILVIWWAIDRTPVITNLESILERDLAAQLQRAVSIDSARIVSNRRLVIDRIRIADGRSFEQGTLFTARRVTVDVSILSLLTAQRSFLSSIRGLTILEPRLLLVRDRAGRWNIDDLLRRPPTPPGERFRGIVRVTSGRLTVRDYASLLATQPAINSLGDVNGAIDFRGLRTSAVDISARGVGGRLGRLTLRGVLGSNAPQLTSIDAAVTGADAGYWLDYFSTIRSWSLRGGTLDGSAEIYQTRNSDFTARGTVTFSGSSLASPYLAVPLRSAKGEVSFVGSTLKIEASASLGLSPVLIGGSVLPNRTLDLQVSSDRMDPLTLLRAVPALPEVPNSRWPVPLSFRARVFGPNNNPQVRVSLSIPRAVIYGIPASDITASAAYGNLVIRVSDLRARIGGGTSRLTAVIQLPSGQSTINGSISGVRLAQVPIRPGASVNGVADARFSVEWLRGLRSGNITATVRNGLIGDVRFSSASGSATLTGPRSADGVIRFTDGSYRNLAITGGSANLGIRGSTINVSRGVVTTAGGTVRTAGVVTTTGRLGLSVTADSIDMQMLLGPLGYRQIFGIADFNGRLTGTLSSPVLTGAIPARSGRIQQISFDFLRGRITATPQYVLLSDAVITRQGTRIAISGFIRIERGEEPQVELTATGQQTDIAQIAAILGITLDATGTADFDLRIAGRFPDVTASGAVTVTAGTISGFAVDSARVVIRSAGNVMRIDELVAVRDGMRLVGSGYIGPQDRLDLQIRGENLNLALANDALTPYIVASGPVELSGTVSGRLSQPVFQGSITAEAPTVNGVPFDRLTGRISWDGTVASLSDASLSRADVLYRIATFESNVRTDSIVLETDIVSGRLERILELVRNSPYVTTPEGQRLRDALATVPAQASGDVDASLTLSGLPALISGSASIRGRSIVLGEQNIDTFDMAFAAQESRFSLSDLTIRAPGVDISAFGQFVGGEPTSYTALVTDTLVEQLLDLIQNVPFLTMFEFGQSLVSAAQAIPGPASGLLNATASVTDVQIGGIGTIRATISDLIVDGQPVGTATADAGIVGGATVIRALTIVGPQGSLSVEGTVDAEQIASLRGRVTGLRLPLIADAVGIPDLTGSLDAIFEVTGSLDEPRVEASLTASDVSTTDASVDSIAIPVIVIAGGRLTAAQITAVADGSQILASASLPFSWEAPMIPGNQQIDVRLDVPTQDLGILTQFLPIVESASGTLAVSVSIGGTIDDPATSGTLLVQDGRLDVQRFGSDFTELQIEATFTNSTLSFNRFTGASSLGGAFEVTGAVQLPSLRRAVVDATLAMNALRLDAENLTGVYGEEVSMTATGLLDVTESLAAPLIAGDLVVSDAVIDVPSGDLPDPTVPAYTVPNPRFDVTLNLASNVTIERGPLEVSVEGPVSIAGTLAQPDIVGTVGLAAGTLRYPGRTFTLVPGGSATFVWQAPEPPSIAVDLRATTRAIAQSPFSAAVARYTIYLDVSGTIDSLTIDVSSSPPGLSQEEALALVFRQAEIEALLSGTPFLQIVEQQLAETLLGLALPGIFEGIEFGPFTIGLEPGIAVPLQAWVSLQLSDQVTLSYLQTLIAGEPFDILELSYLISPQYAFSIQLQDDGEALYLVQAGWRF